MKVGNRPTLSLDVSRYPKLDDAQAGHLRHFHNLTTQLDGQWTHMMGQETLQELYDALRYQVSMMAYAVGTAHYHRLPAARSMFKKLMDQVIHKMLLRDVWGYWWNASLSGPNADPGRTELRKPWADPIIKENIMYSGHLLMMTSLYAMLFDDDRFEKPGAFTLDWDPMFWGLGTETYRYDNRSVQDLILKQFEESGWVGICCEPNMVFIVCNMFPIIGMRYNDVRDGTNNAGYVLQKFKEAWDKKGMVSANGLYYDWLYYNQDQLMPPMNLCVTAWTNAYMNTWNSDLVKSLYEKQALGYIIKVDGGYRLFDQAFSVEYRKIVEAEGFNASEHNPADLIAKARTQRAANLPPADKYPEPILGCVCKWLSEIGRTEELQGLLNYVDGHLNPTWEKGGLFYPRIDMKGNESDQWIHMDPLTGNAGIAWSRLNVTDGQKIMWEKPWTREDLAKRPWIDGIDLGQGVDTLRAIWDPEYKALVLTLRTWNDDRKVSVTPVARNLPAGTWAVYLNGMLMTHESVEEKGSLSVPVTVGREEIDIVFQPVRPEILAKL